jgi:hypothetical protein
VSAVGFQPETLIQTVRYRIYFGKTIDFSQLTAERTGRDVDPHIGQLLKTQNAFPAKALILIITKELSGLDPVHFV